MPIASATEVWGIPQVKLICNVCDEYEVVDVILMSVMNRQLPRLIADLRTFFFSLSCAAGRPRSLA